jgi:hypothetical protein
MNYQVVKVSSGETIQIRTGVLQGIGAQGPVGPTGPQGQIGEQGPQGEVGPAGEISSFSSEATIATPTAVAADTPTLVGFDSTVRDDLAVITSSTTFTAPVAMDLFFSIWVSFALPADAGDAFRKIQLKSGSTVLASVSGPSNPDVTTDLNLTTTVKATAAQAFQLWATHSDNLSVAVSAGRIAIYRVGSGPQGVAGPTGATGPVGPAGPAGPEGPAGDANSGFDTFADLLP